MSRMINFRAYDETGARLNHRAKLTGRTRTFYVWEAVLTHLEDLKDTCLADRVTDRVAKGEEALHSPEDVERELRLAD